MHSNLLRYNGCGEPGGTLLIGRVIRFSRTTKDILSMHEPLTSEQAAAILESAETVLADASAFLQGLIRIPTVNPPGEAYPACARYMGEHLSTLGYSVEYIDLTPAEVAELAPYCDSQPRSYVIGRLACAQRRTVLHVSGDTVVV